MVQGTYVGSRLPQCTDFVSRDPDMKDSSTDHVWPRLCAKVYTRSRGDPPYNRFTDPHRQVWDCFGKRSSVAGCCWTLCLLLRDPRGEVQVAGKGVEQEKGTLIVLQK